jgi:hypothetical protein
MFISETFLFWATVGRLGNLTTTTLMKKQVLSSNKQLKNKVIGHNPFLICGLFCIRDDENKVHQMCRTYWVSYIWILLPSELRAEGIRLHFTYDDVTVYRN